MTEEDHTHHICDFIIAGSQASFTAESKIALAAIKKSQVLQLIGKLSIDEKERCKMAKVCVIDVDRLSDKDLAGDSDFASFIMFTTILLLIHQLHLLLNLKQLQPRSTRVK